MMHNICFIIGVLRIAQVITDNGMEPRVVKGRLTDIQKHPHSVFLFIPGYQGATVCGGSIVNQRVILTAAHCFENSKISGKIIANVGSSHARKGRKILVVSVIVHPKYDPKFIVNDIAIAGLKHPIVFGPKAKRLMIAKKKRSEGMAKVAGWGAIEEYPHLVFSNYLHEVSVRFMSRSKCREIYTYIGKGTFCGGKLKAKSHPAVGDSGSPLVFENYIQIGLVSYKINSISRSMIIYTDIPYFHKWIAKNAKSVYCKKEFRIPNSNINQSHSHEDEYF